MSFSYCQNTLHKNKNRHKNWQQIFFSNITSKLMVHVQQSYRKKSFANLHPHTTKFVVLKILLARKVKMCWVNFNPTSGCGKSKTLVIIRLIAKKKQLLCPPLLGLLLFNLPIQAFRKTKEPKDQGWRVNSSDFRLLVKKIFNARVVVFILSKCLQIGSYRSHKVALTN